MLHIVLSSVTLLAANQACAVANRDARVVHAAPPALPSNVAPFPGSTPMKLHVSRPVTVEVLATISAQGSLKEAHIVETSHDVAIDQAALGAARQSIYAAKVVNCKPATGQYLFRVTFRPNGT